MWGRDISEKTPPTCSRQVAPMVLMYDPTSTMGERFRILQLQIFRKMPPFIKEGRGEWIPLHLYESVGSGQFTMPEIFTCIVGCGRPLWSSYAG